MERKVYEFIADQTGEKILERKKCPECGEEFAITDKDMEFYDKVSPIFNGQKYNIPAPTLCPDCRQRRRLARRNERKLYKRKCDLTGKSIISIFSPESPYKVYDQKERWSDKWNPMDYGQDFDFSRTFFEQIDELLLSMPHCSLFNDYLKNENSEYINHSGSAKNCYLVFEHGSNEDCMYGYNLYYSNNIVDSSFMLNSQNCYEGVDIINCYTLFFSQRCENCRDSYFLYDCINCSNCFMCSNLTNKSYCIKNEQYTKEEYEKQINLIFTYIRLQNLIKEFADYNKKFPRNYLEGLNNEKSFGNYISNTSNVKFGFDSLGCKDSAYISSFLHSELCYDCHSWGASTKETAGASLCYESCAIGNGVNKTSFSYGCWGSISDNIYSIQCGGCKDVFGSISLMNKQYCILNKQYTKEEYEKLVPKIIEHMKSTGEWGEFFPANISRFGYNETVANEYFPLDRESALKQDLNRQDKEYPINVPEGIELVQAKDLPDNINDVSDEILKKAIICEVSGKPFRIVKPELEFYRKHNLPLPRKHPDIRHLERLSKRAPRKLYLRTCDNCSKEVISVYPQNSDFKVYCDECYKKEIY